MENLINELKLGGKWIFYITSQCGARIGITNIITVVDIEENEIGICFENGDAISIDMNTVMNCEPEDLGYLVTLNDYSEIYMERVACEQ